MEVQPQLQTLLPSPPPTTTTTNNPYPTTFVQADTSSFKQVVQMLTGSSPTLKPATPSGGSPPKPSNSIPPIKTPNKSKLYERRNSRLKTLRLPSSSSSRNNADVLSPSLLDFPSLALSPVTPLIPDPFIRSPASSNSSPSPNIAFDKAAEEKAISEKGFFLHPSPVSTPRDSEPRLLPLFPVTSPRL